jgi:hypothetical protein
MADWPTTTDPEGRTVVFDAGSHLHLSNRRPWLLDHVDVIMETVARPDYRSDDPNPGRERFYREHIDLQRWLRVVVDFNDDPAWVVTAAVQHNDPRG